MRVCCLLRLDVAALSLDPAVRLGVRCDSGRRETRSRKPDVAHSTPIRSKWVASGLHEQVRVSRFGVIGPYRCRTIGASRAHSHLLLRFHLRGEQVRVTGIASKSGFHTLKEA